MRCANNCKVSFCNQGRNCPSQRGYPRSWYWCMAVVSIVALIVLALEAV